MPLVPPTVFFDYGVVVTVMLDESASADNFHIFVFIFIY
ncbi:hypothetical protein BDFB_014069 [Asbolus verrucosus]|uniref:Uncharacterized protein n=1 Tax=Asbolus verrucosus TaxID=1661398 RepID=A0A482VKC0_ASBVE|nr:hypothetical protein BDFB_014069 [Asbolus verrucosus]